jgi:hypothetical protein
VVLLALTTVASAQNTAPPPSVGLYTLPDIGTPYISGSTTYKVGGFSSLFYAGGNEFWTITDRGPNVDSGDNKVFVIPSFQPRIYRLRLTPGGDIKIVDTILLRRPDGGPVSGLPNPGFYSTGEIAYDTTLAPAPTDDWGFDTEGLVRQADGSFWFCEEYAPGIAHVAPNGAVMQRVRPGDGLPLIIKKHVPNRGCEGIAMTPNGKIYTVVQSGMANSYANTASANKNASEKTELLRLVEYDPATGQSRMFAYMMDSYPNSGSNIRRKDIKIGDMAALNDNELLLIEHAQRGSGNAKFIYKVSLVGATPITSEVFETSPGVFKTLEELSRAEVSSIANITPVTKTLVLDMFNAGAGNPAWPVDADKPEGLAVVDASTLVVGNDNDFGVISPNADGKVMLSGSRSRMFVFHLSSPLNYQLGTKAGFLHGFDTVSALKNFFDELPSCVGEQTMSLPIDVSNPSIRDLVITGAEFYQLDTSYSQASPNYNFRRGSNGAIIPSYDYVVTDAPGSAPITANAMHFPMVIPANSHRTIYVTFVAPRPDKRFARALLHTDAQNIYGLDTAGVLTRGLLSFDLFGRGVGGRLASGSTTGLPTAVSFPRTAPGDSSDVTVRFANSGSCLLRVSLRSMRVFSGDVNEFRIITMPAGRNIDPATNDLLLDPGMRDSVVIRFQPSRPGSRRATMWLQTNDSTIENSGYTTRGFHYIDLFGNGKSSLQADDIDLGTALIGGGAAEHRHGTVHFENTSDETFVITGMLIEGADSSEFLQDGSSWPALPRTVMPGERFDLGVAFAPAAGGNAGPRNARIRLILKNGDTVDVMLGGIAGTRVLTVSPGSVTFPVISKQKSARRSITIKNNGTMPLRIDQPVVGGSGDFSIGLLPRLDIQPGQSEVLEVTYHPTAAGSSSATLTILSNATLPGGLAVVALNGTAVKTHGADGGDPSQTTTGAIGLGDGATEDGSGLEVSGFDMDAVAGGLSLSGSVPSPARDVVTIGYTLPRRCEARIELFDGNGRFLRTLEAGDRESGRHTVEVRVSDLAAGTYHYRLTAGGLSVARTLTVVR